MKHLNFCSSCITVHVEINFTDLMIPTENCWRKVGYCCGGAKTSLELPVGASGEGNQLLGLPGGICRHGVPASADDTAKRVGSHTETSRGMEVHLLSSASHSKSYFAY